MKIARDFRGKLLVYLIYEGNLRMWPQLGIINASVVETLRGEDLTSTPSIEEEKGTACRKLLHLSKSLNILGFMITYKILHESRNCSSS